MSTIATPADFHVAPEAGAWADLGASTVKFNRITAYGQKADRTANDGNVRIRPKNGTGYFFIVPGTPYELVTPNGGFYRADQFEIWVETSGDGIYAQYSSAIIYDGP